MGVILWRIALLLKPLRGSPQSVPELHGKMMVSMNGNPNPRNGEKDEGTSEARVWPVIRLPFIYFDKRIQTSFFKWSYVC